MKWRHTKEGDNTTSSLADSTQQDAPKNDDDNSKCLDDIQESDDSVDDDTEIEVEI